MDSIKVRSQVDKIMDQMGFPDLPYELIKKRIFPALKDDGTFETMKVVTVIAIGDHILKPTGDNAHVTKNELKNFLTKIMSDDNDSAKTKKTDD